MIMIRKKLNIFTVGNKLIIDVVFYKKFDLVGTAENFCENTPNEILYFLTLLFPLYPFLNNE